MHMHSAVQTVVVIIISYKPLPGLNFVRYNYSLVPRLSDLSTLHEIGEPGDEATRYTGQHALFPFGVYKPLVIPDNPSSRLNPLALSHIFLPNRSMCCGRSPTTSTNSLCVGAGATQAPVLHSGPIDLVTLSL